MSKSCFNCEDSPCFGQGTYYRKSYDEVAPQWESPYLAIIEMTIVACRILWWCRREDTEKMKVFKIVLCPICFPFTILLGFVFVTFSTISLVLLGFLLISIPFFPIAIIVFGLFLFALDIVFCIYLCLCFKGATTCGIIMSAVGVGVSFLVCLCLPFVIVFVLILILIYLLIYAFSAPVSVFLTKFFEQIELFYDKDTTTTDKNNQEKLTRATISGVIFFVLCVAVTFGIPFVIITTLTFGIFSTPVYFFVGVILVLVAGTVTVILLFLRAARKEKKRRRIQKGCQELLEGKAPKLKEELESFEKIERFEHWEKTFQLACEGSETFQELKDRFFSDVKPLLDEYERSMEEKMRIMNGIWGDIESDRYYQLSQEKMTELSGILGKNRTERNEEYKISTSFTNEITQLGDFSVGLLNLIQEIEDGVIMEEDVMEKEKEYFRQKEAMEKLVQGFVEKYMRRKDLILGGLLSELLQFGKDVEERIAYYHQQQQEEEEENEIVVTIKVNQEGEIEIRLEDNSIDEVAVISQEQEEEEGGGGGGGGVVKKKEEEEEEISKIGNQVTTSEVRNDSVLSGEKSTSDCLKKKRLKIEK